MTSINYPIKRASKIRKVKLDALIYNSLIRKIPIGEDLPSAFRVQVRISNNCLSPIRVSSKIEKFVSEPKGGKYEENA